VVALQLEEEELGDAADQRQAPGHRHHHLHSQLIFEKRLKKTAILG
jgi:hypothetical protein